MQMTAQRVQFELHRRLSEVGVTCEVEVRLPAGSERSRSGFFFADLAVIRGREPVALCECKALARELCGRQRENYECSGLPYMVVGADNLDAAVKWCERMWDTGGHA